MNLRSSLVSCISFAIFSLFILTGCGDIQQDLYLNKDGSGILETSFDYGELLGMADSFKNIGFDQDTVSDDTIPDTIPLVEEPPKDAMTLLMEKITSPDHDVDFDTTMTLLSFMPDSIREKETQSNLANKISVRMKSPALSSDLTIGIVMNFDNPAQLKELVMYMANLNPDAMASAGPVEMDAESFISFDSDMKAGWIRFDTIHYTAFATQIGMSQDSAMSSEDLGMIEMMFGNSRIKSMIHVPGEVISCSNPDAILTKDNRVLIEYPFMDVIKKGRINGYTIHFKP